MSARADILANVRRALGVTGTDILRRKAVHDRLARAPVGVIPARGQFDAGGRKALFRAEAERVFASVAELASAADIPAHVAAFLRDRNLPLRLRRGADVFFDALPWHETALTLDEGRADPADHAGLSHAFGAVAETGTLALVSGPDNPTTLNFLPETHIVVVEAEKIVGDYETLWRKLRAAYGKGAMPRTVNFITGPSRSADIAQTMLLGAHGPRALHIIIVG